MIHILGYASKHWKHLSDYQALIDHRLLYRLRHWSLHHSGKVKARGMNKEQRKWVQIKHCWSWSKQEQLILVQEVDSKVGELIYLLRGVVLREFRWNEPIPIRNIKEIHENSSKNSKFKHFLSSTDWLFWMILRNFNWLQYISQPLTHFPSKKKSFSTKLLVERNIE